MNYKIIGKKGLILSLITLLLVLSACSSTTGGNSVTNNPPATNSPANNPGSDGEKVITVKKVITVSVVSSNRFLDLAKQKFEAANPDIRIEIKESNTVPKSNGTTSSAGNDPVAIEKYVTTVNAELMNGNASDIIAVDSLAYSKYADKKLLADLKELMMTAEGFNQDDYYMNIFDALQYKGGLYTLPYGVTTGVWFGNEERLQGLNLDPKAWTWDQFTDKMGSLAKDGSGDTVVRYMRPDQLILDRVSQDLGKFMDVDQKKANFQDKAFVDMLQQAKSFYDLKIFKQPTEQSQGISFKAGESLNLKDAFSPSQLRDYNSIGFGHTIFNKPVLFSTPTSELNQGNSFKSNMLLSVNNKSANKKEAWSFLQFLLSEEMQSSPDMGGLPVNKKASQEQIDALSQNQNFKLTPEEIQTAKDLLPQLKRYSGIDPKIESILVEETASFFSGQKSAESVAKTIQNKVKLYLEE